MTYTWVKWTLTRKCYRTKSQLLMMGLDFWRPHKCAIFFSIWMLVTQLCPFIHCIYFFKLDVKFHWKVKQKASLWPKKTLSSLMNFQFLFYITWRPHINQITQTQNQRVISNTFLLLSTQSINHQSQYLSLKYVMNIPFHPHYYYYYCSNSAVILYLPNIEPTKKIIHRVQVIVLKCK